MKSLAYQMHIYKAPFTDSFVRLSTSRTEYLEQRRNIPQSLLKSDYDLYHVVHMMSKNDLEQYSLWTWFLINVKISLPRWGSFGVIIYPHEYYLTGKILSLLWIGAWIISRWKPSQIAKFMGLYGAHLGPVGPRWAPCWPQEPCYQGWIIGNATHQICWSGAPYPTKTF